MSPVSTLPPSFTGCDVVARRLSSSRPPVAAALVVGSSRADDAVLPSPPAVPATGLSVPRRGRHGSPREAGAASAANWRENVRRVVTQSGPVCRELWGHTHTHAPALFPLVVVLLTSHHRLTSCVLHQSNALGFMSLSPSLWVSLPVCSCSMSKGKKQRNTHATGK